MVTICYRCTYISEFYPFPAVGNLERWREVLIMGLIPTFALPSFIYFNTELRLNGLLFPNNRQTFEMLPFQLPD